MEKEYKNYTWELPWDIDDPRSTMFGGGSTVIITDTNDEIVAFCPMSRAIEIVTALRDSVK